MNMYKQGTIPVKLLLCFDMDSSLELTKTVFLENESVFLKLSKSGWKMGQKCFFKTFDFLSFLHQIESKFKEEWELRGLLPCALPGPTKKVCERLWEPPPRPPAFGNKDVSLCHAAPQTNLKAAESWQAHKSSCPLGFAPCWVLPGFKPWVLLTVL